MIATIPVHDAFTITAILVGIVCHALHRRLPKGLGSSLFVAGTTAGAAVAAFHHNWPNAETPAEWAQLATHITAGLCVLWALLGRWAARTGPHIVDADPADSAPTFFAWSLVTGIAAAVLVVFALVFAIWRRVANPHLFDPPIHPTGLWDLTALLAAVGLWVITRRRPQQPTLLLAVSTLFVLWSAMIISGGHPRLPEPAIDRWLPSWWTWTLHVQIGLAGLLVVSLVLREASYRRQLADAWPDRLDDMIAPYAAWPGFVALEEVIATLVLVLGVYQIVRPGDWPGSSAGVAAVGSAAAGAACFFLAYRQWRPNIAGLAVALITLAVVLSGLLAASQVGSGAPEAEYASRYPVLCNAVLFGLLITIAFWCWLSDFWGQQLSQDGVAWTTAGRMIPTLGRAAFLLAALAMLTAYQMAIWPEQVATGHRDDSIGRVVSGLIAIALLSALCGRRAVRLDSLSWATLAVGFAVGAVLFGVLRLPTSSLSGWLSQYESVVLALVCIPTLTLAELCAGTRFRSLATPLWLLALLAMPAQALWLVLPVAEAGSSFEAVLPSGRLPAEWVRPTTLAIAGAVFSLAAAREGRRAMLALGVALLLAAATTLYQTFGGVKVP